MTEKNIFVYKLFLLLNILDFSLFFMWKLQSPWNSPPEKSHVLFPRKPPLKTEILQIPPFQNLVGTSPLPLPLSSRKGGGRVHTMQRANICSKSLILTIEQRVFIFKVRLVFVFWVWTGFSPLSIFAKKLNHRCLDSHTYTSVALKT